MTESKRSGERLPKAAQRVNVVNQFTGFLGLTESRPLGKVEIDCRRLARRANRDLRGRSRIASSGESRPLGKVEIDCRKAAPKEERVGRSSESTAEDRLTEGWPAGRSIGGDASQRPTAGWPEGRIETFGEGRDRLPQGSSEGGAGRGDPANQLSGSEHPRDSAMVKGKVKRVAQGGQP